MVPTPPRWTRWLPASPQQLRALIMACWLLTARCWRLGQLSAQQALPLASTSCLWPSKWRWRRWQQVRMTGCGVQTFAPNVEMLHVPGNSGCACVSTHTVPPAATAPPARCCRRAPQPGADRQRRRVCLGQQCRGPIGQRHHHGLRCSPAGGRTLFGRQRLRTAAAPHLGGLRRTAQPGHQRPGAVPGLGLEPARPVRHRQGSAQCGDTSSGAGPGAPEVHRRGWWHGSQPGVHRPRGCVCLGPQRRWPAG
jgi:hypothetical protein